MSLLNNKYISIYRDLDFEAFYDADRSARKKIIVAHLLILLVPLVFTFFMFFQVEIEFLRWTGFGFGVMLYTIMNSETAAYMFPESREVYKKRMGYIYIPLVIIMGYVGYSVGYELGQMGFTDEEFYSDFYYTMFGIVFSVALFGFCQFGIAQVTRAAKSIWYDKAEVEADLRFATEVQERILSDRIIENDFAEGWGTSVPASELGGDYFELSESADSLYASIGDISGHSFGAGLLMTTCKSALHTHLQYTNDPADVLSKLNMMMLEQSDKSMFATMALLRLDKASSEVTLSSAGHLPVLHFSDGKLHHRYVKAPGLGMSKRARYENITFPVKSGDLFLIYSDGLIETRDENGKIRAPEFFEDIVTKSAGEHSGTAKELGQLILERVQESDHSERFEDDATLIAIHIK